MLVAVFPVVVLDAEVLDDDEDVVVVTVLEELPLVPRPTRSVAANTVVVHPKIKMAAQRTVTNLTK